MSQQPASSARAWRAGWRYGVAACAAIAGDVGVQQLRRMLGWPRGTTTWLNWPALALPLVLVIIASYRAARASGNMNLGARAGTIAAVMPATLLGLAIAVADIVAPSGKLTPTENLKIALIIAALGPIVGAMWGYVLAYLPAWVGRLVFRRHDAQYIARREARPRLTPAERLKKWRKENLLPAIAAMGIIVLVTLIILLPHVIATWLVTSVPGWWITLSIGAVALSVALLVAFRKHLRIRVGTNQLALFLLALGLEIGFVSSRAGWMAILTHAVIPMLSIWLIFANGMDATMARPLRELDEIMAELTGAGQPAPPVYFHTGGEVLTYYPSRRTLALHLLFAGALGLLFFAVLFIPGAPPVIQVGVALFGALSLTFGVVPDLVRLLVRWPALVVTGEGIIDQGSLGLYGFGLIPWNQVEGFFATRANLRLGRFREVHIVATHEDRLIAAQPIYKRPLLTLMTRSSTSIPISAIVLAQPPERIIDQIMAYMKQYGPTDYVNAFTEQGALAGERPGEAEDA